MQLQRYATGCVVILASISFACGKKKEGDSGEVKVEFAKTAAASLNDMELTGSSEGFVAAKDLTTLKIKPIAVRISTNNQGGYMIWGSKNCKGEESKLDQDKKEFPYFSEHTCTSNAGDDWLNMLDPVELNKTLNSQAWPIPPGKYHYVGLIFCSPAKTETTKTLSYQAPHMGKDNEVVQCDPFTGYSEEGITVGEGEALTISVTYDLDKLVDTLTHTSDMPKRTVGAFDFGCYWVDVAATGGQIQYCPKFGQGAIVPKLKK